MAASDLLTPHHETAAPAPGSQALTPAEQAILDALRSARGRVVTRTELARAAGLRHHPRRVDALLVAVRRALGADAIHNVRSRGWMLIDPADRGPATTTRG